MTVLQVISPDTGVIFRVDHYDKREDYVHTTEGSTVPLIDYKGRRAVFMVLP